MSRICSRTGSRPCEVSTTKYAETPHEAGSATSLPSGSGSGGKCREERNRAAFKVAFGLVNLRVVRAVVSYCYGKRTKALDRRWRGLEHPLERLVHLAQIALTRASALDAASPK